MDEDTAEQVVKDLRQDLQQEEFYEQRDRELEEAMNAPSSGSEKWKDD